MEEKRYVAVMAILNAMLARVSSSMPQIDQATRGLWPADVPADARVDGNAVEKS
jgi:hypothetical protein